MDIEKRYKVKGPSVEEISQSLDKLWNDLQRDDSRISKKAKAAGLNLKELRTWKNRSEAISVKYEGAGLDPGTIAILIKVGAELIKILLEQVIIPMLREEKGADSLTPQDPPKDPTKPTDSPKVN